MLFILHADHEQNCSTNAVRSVGSSQVDPYSAVAAGVGALFGPLHGGANEAVLRMLSRIGSKENIPDFIEGVKDGNERLMGFGHRVYKNYDPRAKIIKKSAEDVFEVTGTNPLLDIALELEKIALEDEYFVKRKLYPNVDFYSGLIYEAFQFPPEMFTVLFAIGRTPGWLAQWLELVQDKEQKIARPKQIYTGDRTLDFVPRVGALGDQLSNRPGRVVFDLGNVLIHWEPYPAVAAGVGDEEAQRFLDADDFDFMAWNHVQDAGGPGPTGGRRTPQPPALGARTRSPTATTSRARWSARCRAPRPGARAARRRCAAVGADQLVRRALPARAAAFRVLGLLDDVVVSGTERWPSPIRRSSSSSVARTGLPAADLVFVDDNRRQRRGCGRERTRRDPFTGADDVRQELRDRGLPV